MLVLTRREGETIRIGDNIEVVVRRVAGNRVTIAVAAPRDVRILRGELEPFHDAARQKSHDRIRSCSVEEASEPYAIVQGTIPRSAMCRSPEHVVS